MRQHFVNSALMLILLFGVPSAQEVTFDVYPSNAEIKRGGGTPSGTIPLGQANEPIDLSGQYEQSVIKLIVEADGRKRWEETFTSGSIKPGKFPKRIYLHPKNPLMYLVDFPLAFPGIFAVVFLVLSSGIVYWVREESAKKRAAKREADMAALGAEYEKSLGDYTLIKDLGQGAMGLVRLGIRKGSVSRNDLVAVKTIILPSDDKKDEVLARFRREAKILTDTNHPNILRLYDWAYHKGSYEIRTQPPLFIKPGTFDKFSKGNRILTTG